MSATWTTAGAPPGGAQAEQAVAGAHEEPVGHARLTAPVMFGDMRVMPIVRKLLDDYPAVRASVLLVDRVVNLVEEGLDSRCGWALRAKTPFPSAR